MVRLRFGRRAATRTVPRRENAVTPFAPSVRITRGTRLEQGGGGGEMEELEGAIHFGPVAEEDLGPSEEAPQEDRVPTVVDLLGWVGSYAEAPGPGRVDQA